MPEQPQSLESQLKMARPRRSEVKRVPLTPEEKEFLGEIMKKAVAAEKAGRLKEALDFYTDYRNELMKIKEKKESEESLFDVEVFDFNDAKNKVSLRKKEVSEALLKEEVVNKLLLSLNKSFMSDLDLKEFWKKSDDYEKMGFLATLPMVKRIILQVEGIEGILVGAIYRIDENHEEYKWFIVPNIKPDDILDKQKFGIIKDIENSATATQDVTGISLDSGRQIAFGTFYNENTGHTNAYIDVV